MTFGACVDTDSFMVGKSGPGVVYNVLTRIGRDIMESVNLDQVTRCDDTVTICDMGRTCASRLSCSLRLPHHNVENVLRQISHCLLSGRAAVSSWYVHHAHIGIQNCMNVNRVCVQGYLWLRTHSYLGEREGHCGRHHTEESPCMLFSADLYTRALTQSRTNSLTRHL